MIAVALTWISFRIVLSDTPIYASDEYAYFAAAQFYPHLSLLYQLDPYLQQTGNVAFQWVAHRFFVFGPDLAIRFAQFWHFLLWLVTGLLLFLVARGAFGRRAAVLSVAAFFCLPMSSYTASFLPEIDFIFIFVLIFSVFILYWRERPSVASAVCGCLIALALLIKPHAIAILAASLLFQLSRLVGPQRMAARRIVLSIACFGIAFLFANFGLRATLSTGGVALQQGWVGNFYASYLQAGLSPDFWLRNALGITKYFFAHLVVIALLFPVTAVVVTGYVVRMPKCRLLCAEGNARHDDYLAFLASSFFAFVSMISVFSQQTASASAFEAMRLHGRYLLCLFPLMLVPLFQLAVERPSVLARYSAAVLATGAVVMAVWVAPNFKIFPWDYPELFAFYSPANNSGWNWRWSPIDLGSSLLAACLLAGVVGAISVRFSPRSLFIAFLLTALVGNAQHFAWLYSHLRNTQNVARAANAVRLIVRDTAAGDGVVVGADRYGRMSFVMMGLATAPRVLLKAESAEITDEDLPEGLKWALLANDYNFRATYSSTLRVGDLQLILLRDSSASIREAGKPSWDGSPLKVSLGSRHSRQLVGFNEPETWGAWTAMTSAEILLPRIVVGALTVRLSAWTLPENSSSQLTMKIGGHSVSTRLGDRRSEIVMDFPQVEPTDRLFLTMTTIRPPDSHRQMGAAIAEIEITRKD